MMDDMERRVTMAQLQIREVGDARTTVLGYAAIYNSLSDDLGGFRERILPGAFDDALLPNADVRALWQHNEALVLGRTTNGTLRLWSDEIGLRFEIEPPETQWARDALVSLRRGDVNQMSFGFIVPEGGDEWRKEGDGLVVRILRRVRLFEISAVTFPAYPMTSVLVRMMAVRLRAQQGRNDPEARMRAQARHRERVLMLALE